MTEAILCPKCGAHARFNKDDHGNVVFCCGSQPFMQQAGLLFSESTECLRRQLAAAEAKLAGIVQLRLPLAKFALAMEATLKANDDKGGWDDDHPNWLRHRLADEVKELAVEVFSGNYGGMMREAVDVANFAMMIYGVAAICAERERRGDV